MGWPPCRARTRLPFPAGQRQAFCFWSTARISSANEGTAPLGRVRLRTRGNRQPMERLKTRCIPSPCLLATNADNQDEQQQNYVYGGMVFLCCCCRDTVSITRGRHEISCGDPVGFRVLHQNSRAHYLVRMHHTNGRLAATRIVRCPMARPGRWHLPSVPQSISPTP